MFGSMKNVRFNLLLLIYILINTDKNYNITHLQLNYRDVLEVVILLMTYLIMHVFQTENLNIYVFNMLTRKNQKF